jgi:high-affinity iron transporter
MSQYPLWDTSEWISERSITGQMLYALLGYEATPTPIQAAAYLIAIVFTLAASYLSLRLKKQHHEQ